MAAESLQQTGCAIEEDMLIRRDPCILFSSIKVFSKNKPNSSTHGPRCLVGFQETGSLRLKGLGFEPVTSRVLLHTLHSRHQVYSYLNAVTVTNTSRLKPCPPGN
ncbi:hypothetical protein CEXT_469571 [Caerostris extrusa]|uniref:Uncharacterized protein n=1 Tax=Caerostris extrusa TaxID=172846 RepID=A0AAV4VYQ8_CAEEX|nr:hypothetical protein CEXT_469571 [Caerostris extrusa]